VSGRLFNTGGDCGEDVFAGGFPVRGGSGWCHVGFDCPGSSLNSELDCP
jgi:hypothetical protein